MFRIQVKCCGYKTTKLYLLSYQLHQGLHQKITSLPKLCRYTIIKMKRTLKLEFYIDVLNYSVNTILRIIQYCIAQNVKIIKT